MKPTPTPSQLRRAEYARLVASLPVPQYTTLAHGYAAKQKPAGGAYRTI